jgi:RNA polymerase sigma-70 factor, ECF subfamily
VSHSPSIPLSTPVLPLPSRAAEATPLHILTSGLARGDDAAWAQFHREYGPRIFRQLLAVTRGDHDLASEALQHSYLRIARYARPCDSEAQFAGWLRVVARTALSDCRRRQRSFLHLLNLWSVHPIATESSTDEEEKLQTALDYALAQLKPEDRTLLEAKYLSGFHVRVIAGLLNLPAKTIESRLTRARADLRQQLQSALARDE